MKIPTLFKEYIWLIETIYQAGRITFAEINEKWRLREESGGVDLARTTFNRHRDAILDMFGVIIDCDRKDCYRYYIYNREVLNEDSVANWLFSTLSVSNMLDENVGLQDRILLETIPSGDAHLKMIIKAMHENHSMLMTYRRYGAVSSNTFSVSPYCIKLFKRRWYILARMDHSSKSSTERKSSLAVFSIDRIESIEIQQQKFEIEPDFNAVDYFGECYGIVVGDGTKPERIVLRAYGREPYNMRGLPIHHSQREIVSTDKYTDFEVNIRPTSDFKAYLLSRGEWLQVISPEWLAKDIQSWLEAALCRYKKEEKQ